MKRGAPLPPPPTDREVKAALSMIGKVALAPFNRMRFAMPKSYYGEAYDRWMKRQREVTAEVVKKLEAEGAKIVEQNGTTRFELLGFKATSTMGLQGAVRNWIGQVKDKRGIRS